MWNHSRCRQAMELRTVGGAGWREVGSGLARPDDERRDDGRHAFPAAGLQCVRGEPGVVERGDGVAVAVTAVAEGLPRVVEAVLSAGDAAVAPDVLDAPTVLAHSASRQHHPLV